MPCFSIEVHLGCLCYPYLLLLSAFCLFISCLFQWWPETGQINVTGAHDLQDEDEWDNWWYVQASTTEGVWWHNTEDDSTSSDPPHAEHSEDWWVCCMSGTLGVSLMPFALLSSSWMLLLVALVPFFKNLMPSWTTWLPIDAFFVPSKVTHKYDIPIFLSFEDLSNCLLIIF